jgi:hypothetical protein
MGGTGQHGAQGFGDRFVDAAAAQGFAGKEQNRA